MAKISYTIDGPSAALTFAYDDQNAGDVDAVVADFNRWIAGLFRASHAAAAAKPATPRQEAAVEAVAEAEPVAEETPAPRKRRKRRTPAEIEAEKQRLIDGGSTEVTVGGVNVPGDAIEIKPEEETQPAPEIPSAEILDFAAAPAPSVDDVKNMCRAATEDGVLTRDSLGKFLKEVGAERVAHLDADQRTLLSRKLSEMQSAG